MSKTDKELLDEITTREGLERRGYRKVKCASCHGTGRIIGYGWNSCMVCGGKGHKWEAPLR